MWGVVDEGVVMVVVFYRQETAYESRLSLVGSEVCIRDRCGCAGVQVCGCAGVQVCGCAGVQVCGCAGARVCGCAGAQVCG